MSVECLCTRIGFEHCTNETLTFYNAESVNGINIAASLFPHQPAKKIDSQI